MTIEQRIDLVAELEKHRLLVPAQLDEARGLGDTAGGDARELAAELIRRNWLTPFQANQLLQGRGGDLMLGPYVLLERIGQGGMGQVYKARHAVMDRLIALKILRADAVEVPSALDRFRREIQAAARLTHPNVVLAHDANQIGDTFFLVMEYVEGIDLARLLGQRGRLPPPEAADCARQAALGLQHAHEHGLVHRDIKPSNLIRATSGTVKLLDLGLARLHAETDAASGPLTHEGSVMGTPDYMAPEQADDSRHADIRADIYSLGCTLYHLLAGQPPFPGGSMAQKLLKHQRETPPPVEQFCPSVPPGLANVVRKMMAKRPKDRYQTPAEVADALAPFAAAGAAGAAAAVPAEALAAPETPTVDWTTNTEQGVVRAARTKTAHRRAPRPVLLLVAGLLAVLALVVVAVAVAVLLVLFFVVGSPRMEKHPSSPEAVEEKDPAIEKIPPIAPIERIPPIVPIKGDAPPPGKGIGQPEHLPLLAEAKPSLLRELRGHTGKISCLAFSPDGHWLASGGADNLAVLWDVRSGEQQGPALRHKHRVRAVAWAPDGKRFASASWGGAFDAAIKLWDTANPGEGQTLVWQDRTGTPMKADVRTLAFSPDGTRLASGGGPLRIWNLGKEGEPAQRAWQETFPSYLYAAAFSPDGKRIAVGCHEIGDNVRVWDADTAGDPLLLRGNERGFGLAHSDVAGVVAFAGGGKLLVRVTSDGRGAGQNTASAWVWDADLRRQKFQLRDKHTLPGGAVFALSSAADGGLRVAVGEGTVQFPAPFRMGPQPPPGEIQLWDGATKKVTTFDSKHKSAITALAFSPDGRRLATGSEDQSVKIWELTR